MRNMDLLSKFITELEKQIANHSIYIWGGSGQLCKNITESWIREKEARSDGGKHTYDAIEAWKEVMSTPYKDVARCFDCSGYVSYCLKQIGVLDSRTNCDGLYAKCEPRKLESKPENGTLLFRVNSKNANDETHVGVYYNGYQYHAKGRTHGVVKEKYKKSYWAKAGWYKKLKSEETVKPEPSHDPDQYIFTRNLKYGCKGEDVVELKKLLIAHGYKKGITVNKDSSKNFGSATKNMVRKYQIEHRLVPDGIAGRNTITSLGGTYDPS